MNSLINSIVMLLFVSLSGCKHDLVDQNARGITIIIHPVGKPQDTVVITNKHEISGILSEINSAHREVAKFKADYGLEVQYSYGVKRISFNHSYIRIEGIPYKADCDIGDKIRIIVHH